MPRVPLPGALALAACLLAAGPALPLAAPPVPGPLELAPAVAGQWSLPGDSGVEAIHAVLLPTGRILLYSSNHAARLLDPATGALRDAALPFGEDVFCSGHTLLPDGRVLVMGGTKPGYFFRGEEESFLFDPWTEAWSRGPSMATGRWYPTPVTLGDGRVLVFSGLDGVSGAYTPLVEELAADASAWRVVPGADLAMSLYPRMFLLPTGEVVRAGHEGRAVFFDPATGAWRQGPGGADHWQGSAVLLPGLDRILVSGGISGVWDAAPTAHVLELDATPSWQTASSMWLPRRDHNLVLLADGAVLAVGGGAGPFLPGPAVDQPLVWHLHGEAYATLFRWPSQLNAERYDPATGQWSLLAPALRGRTYHSTALLLPDGRVWVSGSDVETNPLGYEADRSYEVFSPPHLFQGPRPAIAAAPGAVGYGGAFGVATPDAGAVGRVAMVRLGSSTHAFNFDQRYVDLAFTAAGGALRVEGPPGPDHAPPGWYMLFLVSDAGVPSVARFVHVA